MIQEEVVQVQLKNYLHDKQYINKLQHNLNNLFDRVGIQELIGKRFEILKQEEPLPHEKKKKMILKDSSIIRLPRIIQKNQFELPKYLSVNNYNNYKYQSLFINYIPRKNVQLESLFTTEFTKSTSSKSKLINYQKAQLAKKKGMMNCKKLPAHLQVIKQKSNKIFELNNRTRQQISLRSQDEEVQTDYSEAQSLYRSQVSLHDKLQTLNSDKIKRKYDKILIPRKMQNETNEWFQQDVSQSVSEINVNNFNLEKILKQKKDLTVNPYVLSFQPQKQIKAKIMNVYQEFQILVSNTFKYLQQQNREEELNNATAPFIFQFILREAYKSFQQLNKTIQDRILLAFDLNPQSEESKMEWNQFLFFNQMIILQNFKKKQCIEFLIKFFNPDDAESIQMQDIKAIIRIICSQIDQESLDSKDRPVEDIFMENILLSEQFNDNGELTNSNLASILKAGCINVDLLMECLLNNI